MNFLRKILAMHEPQQKIWKLVKNASKFECLVFYILNFEVEAIVVRRIEGPLTFNSRYPDQRAYVRKSFYRIPWNFFKHIYHFQKW